MQTNRTKEDIKMNQSGGIKELNLIGTPPCLFADGFVVSKRGDGLFLIDFTTNVPQGKLVSSRAIMTIETISKLFTVTQDILKSENAVPADFSTIQKINFKSE